MERSLWVTVGSLITGQVPDDERLVARTRQEHVWVLERSRKRGDPAAVSLEGALEDKLFRHIGVLIWLTGRGIESWATGTILWKYLRNFLVVGDFLILKRGGTSVSFLQKMDYDLEPENIVTEIHSTTKNHKIRVFPTVDEGN